MKRLSLPASNPGLLVFPHTHRDQLQVGALMRLRGLTDDAGKVPMLG